MPQLTPQRASSLLIVWSKLANTLQNNCMKKKRIISLAFDTYSCCLPYGTSFELLTQHLIISAIHPQGTVTAAWSTPRAWAHCPQTCCSLSLQEGATLKHWAWLTTATAIHQLISQIFSKYRSRGSQGMIISGLPKQGQKKLILCFPVTKWSVITLHIQMFLVAKSSSRKAVTGINPILWPVWHVQRHSARL